MALEITEATLKKFASNCKADEVFPGLEAARIARQIRTVRQITHWLGHLYHESGGFVRLFENLDYRAERLMVVWPNRFPTLQAAAPYAHNPPALANLVYGKRLGNSGPNDGWTYRGRGYIQLTGKGNYQDASTWAGVDLVTTPQIAGEFDGAAKVAAAFWAHKGLNAIAEGADEAAAIKVETKTINGGLLGLDERKAAIARAQKIWS
jgi:putative chitinase